jgi:CubicO group peptidase (beta-lactamase class C family)
MQQRSKHRAEIVIFLAVACWLTPAAAFAQKSRIALIDDFVAAKHKYHRFNGNVLVAEKGRVIYRRSFGYADFKNKKPLMGESVFNLASISKQFTAAAVMLLAERGLLSLDDALAKYFPEIPYEKIAVRHMLTHTSGLPEQNELMFKYWNSDSPVTNPDMVEYLIKYRPAAAFQPGENFKYCNTNYSLLAMIVEKASGQKFEDFLTKNIFEPLGMKQTRFLKPTAGNYQTIFNQTENYIADTGNKKFLLPREIPEYKNAVALLGMVGAGNIYSTAADLLKWQESLKTEKILKRASIEQMESPQVKANIDNSDAYGFGLAIKSIYDDTRIFHYGGTLGYWNGVQHFKKTDRTIIVLTNNESEKGLTSAVAAILFDQPVALPSEHIEIKLSPAALDRFAGAYELNGNFAFAVENRDGKLYRVTKSGDAKQLKPESKTKLFYADGTDRQIELVYRRRSVKQVFFIADGIKLELKKVK